jgi:hypothetical protein
LEEKKCTYNPKWRVENNPKQSEEIRRYRATNRYGSQRRGTSFSPQRGLWKVHEKEASELGPAQLAFWVLWGGEVFCGKENSMC